MTEISVRDKRRPGFFSIDNEVLDDFRLSPMALTVYCHMARWSGDWDNVPFQTTTALAKRYTKGRATIVAAVKELTDAKLLRLAYIEEKTNVRHYELLPVPKKPVPAENGGRSGTEQGAVLPQNGGRSPTEHNQDIDTKTDLTKSTAAGAALSQDAPSSSLPMGHSPDPGSSQAKKKKGQGGRAAHPDHGRVMALCSDTHLALYGERPVMNGAREGAAVKSLLALAGFDEIERRAKALASVARSAKTGYWRCEITPSVLLNRWSKPELLSGGRVSEIQKRKDEAMAHYEREKARRAARAAQ